MVKIMPPVRHCCRTYPDVNEPYAHCRCASDERLIFYNITRCYGKRMTVFAVAIAAGDIIKYQSFVYGSFVWGIHVRYNKRIYLPSGLSELSLFRVDKSFPYGKAVFVRISENMLRTALFTVIVCDIFTSCRDYPANKNSLTKK